MTVLSCSYGIIMDRSINVPRHGKNVVNEINVNEKIIFEETNGTYC